MGRGHHSPSGGAIDYSQPVLYSHFKNKADIMAAVADRRI